MTFKVGIEIYFYGATHNQFFVNRTPEKRNFLTISACTQKTPPLQLKTDEAKYECDMLANRQYTDITEEQRKENNPKASRLTYTYQAEETDYA